MHQGAVYGKSSQFDKDEKLKWAQDTWSLFRVTILKIAEFDVIMFDEILANFLSNPRVTKSMIGCY